LWAKKEGDKKHTCFLLGKERDPKERRRRGGKKGNNAKRTKKEKREERDGGLHYTRAAHNQTGKRYQNRGAASAFSQNIVGGQGSEL